MTSEKEKNVIYSSKNAVLCARIFEALVERQRGGNSYRSLNFSLSSQGDRCGVLANVGIGVGDDVNGPAQLAYAAEFAMGFAEAYEP